VTAVGLPLVGAIVLWITKRLTSTRQQPAILGKEHLPASAEAFLDSLRLFDNCPICLEPYEANHTAAQIPTCKHVFGLPCLKTWAQAIHSGSNTYLMCEQTTFLPKARSDLDVIAHARRRSLWTAPIDHRTQSLRTRDADNQLEDAGLMRIVHTLGYNEAHWTMLDGLDPLTQLKLTALPCTTLLSSKNSRCLSIILRSEPWTPNAEQPGSTLEQMQVMTNTAGGR
jgi:hypothetical protein